MRKSSGSCRSARLTRGSGMCARTSASAGFSPEGARDAARASCQSWISAGGRTGLALAFPVAGDEGVGEDAVQPGLQVRARLELPERGVRPGERFLDQILGVCPVAGHAQRRGIQLRQVGQRVALEPRGPLPGRFRDGICFLAAPDRHGSARAVRIALPARAVHARAGGRACPSWPLGTGRGQPGPEPAGGDGRSGRAPWPGRHRGLAGQAEEPHARGARAEPSASGYGFVSLSSPWPVAMSGPGAWECPPCSGGPFPRTV